MGHGTSRRAWTGGLLVAGALALPGAQSWPADVTAAPAALQAPAQQVPKALALGTLAIGAAGQRLVAVGERGVVLLSDDSGRQWRQAAAVPVSVSLTAVRFLDARQGWAVGHMGVVIHTADAGEHWTRQLDGIGAAQLVLEEAHRVQAAQPGEAADKAVAQAESALSEGPDKPLLDVLPAADGSVLAVGAYGLALRSEDGGAHWKAWYPHIDNPRELNLYGLARTGNGVFLVGEQGLLLRAEADARDFRALASPYKGSWFGALALADGSLLAYGLRGKVFRTHDSGGHWDPVASGVTASVGGACTLDHGRFALVSYAGDVLVGSADAAVPLQHLATAAPLTGVSAAPDGTLVGSSLRGTLRMGAAK